jgi:hypothetical protein
MLCDGMSVASIRDRITARYFTHRPDGTFLLRFSEQDLWPYMLSEALKERTIRQLLWPRYLAMLGQFVVLPVVVLIFRTPAVMAISIAVVVTLAWNWPMLWLICNFRRTDRVELSLPYEKRSEYRLLRPLLHRWPRQAYFFLPILPALLLLPMIWLSFNPNYYWGGIMGAILFGSATFVSCLNALTLPPPDKPSIPL